MLITKRARSREYPWDAKPRIAIR